MPSLFQLRRPILVVGGHNRGAAVPGVQVPQVLVGQGPFVAGPGKGVEPVEEEHGGEGSNDFG